MKLRWTVAASFSLNVFEEILYEDVLLLFTYCETSQHAIGITNIVKSNRWVIFHIAICNWLIRIFENNKILYINRFDTPYHLKLMEFTWNENNWLKTNKPLEFVFI